MKQTSKGLLLPIVYCTSIFAGLLGVNHTQLLYISKVQVNLLHGLLKNITSPSSHELIAYCRMS